VVELKSSYSNLGFDSDSNLDKGKKIIDAEHSATVTTTDIYPNEPKDLEEGELLFHWQMWVKGVVLHFIVDRRSQNNLISSKVIKWLECWSSTNVCGNVGRVCPFLGLDRMVKEGVPR
jgi:hypothetical protein